MRDMKRTLTCLLLITLISFAPAAFGQGPSLPPPDLPIMPDMQDRDQAPAAPAAPDLPAPDLPATAPGATPVAGSTAAPAPPPKPEPPLPPVSISARTAQTTVARDETARLIITIEYKRAASDPRPPLDFEFPDPPKGEGLTVVGNSLTASTTLEGATVTVTRDYTYDLRADKEGEARIGSVAVKYFWTGGKTKADLKTNEIPLTVTRPKVKLSKLGRNPYAIGGFAVVLLAAVAALAWPALKARRRRAAVAAAPVKSAYDLARERLLEVDRLRMAGEHERFVAACGAEMDRFMTGVMGLRGRAAERAETVAGLLGSDWRGRLSAAEFLADQVRFAGHQPTGPEMDEIMATARKLIDDAERAPRNQ